MSKKKDQVKQSENQIHNLKYVLLKTSNFLGLPEMFAFKVPGKTSRKNCLGNIQENYPGTLSRENI